MDKLRVVGKNITNPKGEIVRLKGVSTHGVTVFPDFVNEDAFRTFRNDWDANLIRLALYTAEENGYCTDGDKEALKEIMIKGVEIATQLGMYVIVDWHILADNDPHINKEESIQFFEEMSDRFKGYNNVIYEICNEPNGEVVTWKMVKEYAEELIPVIRKNDKDAIILVGTPTWSQDVDDALKDPIIGYDNIMYVLHFYAATHKDALRDKLTSVLDKELPVFISEFSICDASGNGEIDYDEAKKWFDLIDKYKLSMAAWNVSNKDESSAIILPNCEKISGWNEEEYSDTAKWIKKSMKEMI